MCMLHGIFCRGVTSYTVIYGVYSRFWPTLLILIALLYLHTGGAGSSVPQQLASASSDGIIKVRDFTEHVATFSFISSPFPPFQSTFSFLPLGFIQAPPVSLIIMWHIIHIHLCGLLFLFTLDKSFGMIKGFCFFCVY